MKIKKFLAPTVPQALLMVKEEFGPRAVILNTRQIKKDGRQGEMHVEVTAALDENLDPGQQTPPSAPYHVDPSLLERLATDLREMKDRLRPVLDFTEEIPTALMEVYVRLVDGGLDEKTAKRMIHRLLVNFTGDVLEDRELVQSKVRDMLEALIPQRHTVRQTDGSTTVVALVGPTGMGKTTTVAKLAAEALLLRGQRVAAIATDDQRIAALDQLKTYASIIGFPVDVVYTMEEMRDAIRLRKQEAVDLVLIDTTGTNPCHEEEVAKLKQMLDTVSPTEVHLVISASTGLETILDTVEVFRHLPIDCLLFTKLDETHRSGVILSTFIRIGLPVSYVTTGRSVPGDIAVADKAVLIETWWR
ncbi:MAG: hypothetical protein HY709_01185 [Candidatus Latescibacteria bacterium]|nr:hypothetical protein [Candidatus Latescibacterota bacterium]